MGKIYENRLKYPLQTISLGKMMLDHLRKNGDHVFIINSITGKKTTYKELYEKSVKLAKFLHQYGIKIGDRISIAAENRADWLIPMYATLFLGAIVTPYNPTYTEYEFQHVLNISKPRIIFVSRRTERIVAKIQPNLSWRMELIQLDDDSFAVRTLTDILNNEKAVDSSRFETTDIGDNSRHPAVILCSSGTTGLPKGVTLSHRSLISSIVKISQPEMLDMRQRDRILMLLPFYHGYALNFLLLGTYNDITMILLPTFEPKLFLTVIQEFKITFIPIVPPILTFMAKHPMVEKYDLSSVREILCGAAPFVKKTVDEVKARTGIKNVRNAYGMTELTVVSNISLRDDVEGSGRVIAGFLSKVVDLETQETLDVGQTGEICFMGDQLMMYYWDNPEATRETIDYGGWLHTGDVGYYDEKGRLHVVDRLKELIKYKGYQVSPSEIEGLLLSHPAVKDAAVAGRPDERSGEVPVAFIVRKPNATVTVQDIQEFIKQKLSPQKWLRGGVQFVDAIPKNSTGKILRRELRAMVAKL